MQGQCLQAQHESLQIVQCSAESRPGREDTEDSRQEGREVRTLTGDLSRGRSQAPQGLRLGYGSTLRSHAGTAAGITQRARGFGPSPYFNILNSQFYEKISFLGTSCYPHSCGHRPHYNLGHFRSPHILNRLRLGYEYHTRRKIVTQEGFGPLFFVPIHSHSGSNLTVALFLCPAG